ncbi:MAG TPA: hypothetical protein VMU59_14715 [Caulobacteraceae bacterium]|nr:hypothetical protein [Caulobacteraceae bacterium]
MASKWKSEEIWRSALGTLRAQIAERERPDFILYHLGVLDEAYTRQYMWRMRRRYERLKADGLQEWRDRYND